MEQINLLVIAFQAEISYSYCYETILGKVYIFSYSFTEHLVVIVLKKSDLAIVF